MQNPDVLIIEDDPHCVELIQRAIKKAPRSVDFVSLPDGEQALEFITHLTNPPKLVILDLKIPKINGLHLISQIRPLEKLSTIPIIVFTSSKDPKDIASAYQHGANSYIVKPLEYKEFYTVVNSIMEYWLAINHSR